eukprot:223640_1
MSSELPTCKACNAEFTSHPDLIAHLQEHISNPERFVIEKKRKTPPKAKRRKKSATNGTIKSENHKMNGRPKSPKSTEAQNIQASPSRSPSPSVSSAGSRNSSSHSQSRSPSSKSKYRRPRVVLPKPKAEPSPYRIKSVSCKICGKELKRASSLTLHMRQHSEQMPFDCNFCDRKFKQRGNLEVHMRTHTGERPFKCEQCGRAFAQNITLQRHMTIHTGQKLFVCPICFNRFKTRTSCLTHQKRMHAYGDKEFLCPHCPKKFTMECLLTQHLYKHATVQCKICKKMFTKVESLLDHEKRHQCKPLKCGQCDKTLATKNGLRTHILSHEKESNRRFPCLKCGVEFERKELLEKHYATPGACGPVVKQEDCEEPIVQQIHPPMKCVLCNKDYKSAHYFSLHMRKHVNGVEVDSECSDGVIKGNISSGSRVALGS